MRSPHAISRPLLPLVVTITIFFVQVTSAIAANAGKSTWQATAKEQLTCAPASLQFGNVIIGQTKSKLVTITNTGRSSLSLVQAASTVTGFSLSGLDIPLILSGGESFTFGVTFAPHASGAIGGSISVVSEAPKETIKIQLAGKATPAGQLSITPTTIDFGDVRAGSNGTQTGKLTATGSDVTVSSATVNNSTFELSGLSLPVTIPAGHSAPFTVIFVPQASKTSSATLSFASDAENSPTAQPVTATIVGSTQHKVGLSWKASKSKHVIGYNIYRGNRSSGPYKKINHGLDPSTNYTDHHVVAGCKYYYVARAVNLRRQESAYSKQVQAAIPCNPVIAGPYWQSEANLLLTCGVCKQ